MPDEAKHAPVPPAWDVSEQDTRDAVLLDTNVVKEARRILGECSLIRAAVDGVEESVRLILRLVQGSDK